MTTLKLLQFQAEQAAAPQCMRFTVSIPSVEYIRTAWITLKPFSALFLRYVYASSSVKLPNMSHPVSPSQKKVLPPYLGRTAAVLPPAPDNIRLNGADLSWGAVSNIVGDWLLVAHLEWGMKGAALATVGAQGVISLIFYISLQHFFRYISYTTGKISICPKGMFLPELFL